MKRIGQNRKEQNRLGQVWIKYNAMNKIEQNRKKFFLNIKCRIDMEKQPVCDNQKTEEYEDDLHLKLT